MIPNMAKEAVELSRLDANSREFIVFMERRHNRLSYYNAETEKLTAKWFAENLLKNVPVANINITRRVVDRISEVYMVEAQRFFELPAPTERYNEKIPKKHERMQRIEKMTNLLDVVAIHPFWDHDKSILDHKVLIEFQPFFDRSNNLVGIRYPLTQSADSESLDEQTFVEWNLDGFRIVDLDGRGTAITPYEGAFPFVLAWTEEPGYFYDHNPTADLVSGNLGVNFYQTCLNGNIGFQSFGQPYITGLQADQKIDWGIDKVPALPDGATAGMLTPPDTVEGVVKAKADLYQSVAMNYHLSADFVAGNVQAESGTHLRLRQQELTNERIGDIPRWQNVEADVYVVERDLLSRMGINLPEVLTVDFSESVEYLSPQEQREKDDWDLAHNLITVKDIAMRNNPDLDEKQAEKLIMDNAGVVNAIEQVGTNQPNIVDQILGAGN